MTTARCTTSRRRTARAWIAAAAIFSGACLGATSAFAHAHLRSAVPPADGMVAVSPTELDLGFSEAVDSGFSGVTVTGPDGKTVPTGKPSLRPGDRAVLMVPLTAPLAPGAYRVDWHALAADGHKTSGHYGFTIRP